VFEKGVQGERMNLNRVTEFLSSKSGVWQEHLVSKGKWRRLRKKEPLLHVGRTINL